MESGAFSLFSKKTNQCYILYNDIADVGERRRLRDEPGGKPPGYLLRDFTGPFLQYAASINQFKTTDQHCSVPNRYQLRIV